MIEFTTHYSGSKGNLYQISDGKTSLLLDPGVPIAQIKKALNFKLSGIAGALCGHNHRDHSEGTAGIIASGIDLYCNQDTAEALELSGHRLHIIKHKKPFNVGTFKVWPLSVPHDVPCFSFLLVSGKEKWFFGIDLLYCPYYFQGLTGIAIGINFDQEILSENVEDGRLDPALGRRIMQSHMSLDVALNFFKAQDLSKVEAIHILHISESNADKEKIKEAVMRQTGKLVIIYKDER